MGDMSGDQRAAHAPRNGITFKRRMPALAAKLRRLHRPFGRGVENHHVGRAAVHKLPHARMGRAKVLAEHLSSTFD